LSKHFLSGKWGQMNSRGMYLIKGRGGRHDRNLSCKSEI